MIIMGIFLKTYPLRMALNTRQILRPRLLVSLTALHLLTIIFTMGSLMALVAHVTCLLSTLYLKMIKSKVANYLDLLGRKMTLKERSARRKTRHNLKLDEMDDPKNNPVRLRLRLTRFYRFFVAQDVPRSVIEADWC